MIEMKAVVDWLPVLIALALTSVVAIGHVAVPW
jgi:hypothetical protein